MRFLPTYLFCLTVFLVSVHRSEGRYDVVSFPSNTTTSQTLICTWRVFDGNGQNKDWVGIYAADAPAGSAQTAMAALYWIYTGGAPTGSVSWYPGTAGAYDCRYFLQNGYTESSRSYPVYVSGPNGTLEFVSPVRTTQEIVVPQGSNLTVQYNFTIGPTTVTDWIGLYVWETCPYLWSSWDYWYTGGRRVGSLSIAMNYSVGSRWRIQSFIRDSYISVATTKMITIGCPVRRTPPPLCNQYINACASTPCFNGANCNSSLGFFSCSCKGLWFGPTCQQTTDICVLANPCANGALCTNRGQPNNYNCSCAPGFVGQNCTVNFDDCASGPCKNGASCVDGIATYSCNCAAGFTGANCTTNIDDCAGLPCKNGGTCTDGVASYQCTCPFGWTGSNCTVNPNDCLPVNPCKNGGACSDLVGTYSCNCAGTGFIGLNCTTNIDDCVSSPCRNGGTCLDGVNSYQCQCVAGFMGNDCSTNIDDCAGMPCLHGGRCIDGVQSFVCNCTAYWTGPACAADVNDCVPMPCMNGGTCTDTGEGMYDCGCASPWAGRDCYANSSNWCAYAPCMNGGSCTNVPPVAFHCDCPTGFTGTDCAINVDDCTPGACLNGGTCLDGVNSFGCSCPDGFIGNVCQIELNFCASQPCAPNGVCINQQTGYLCNCTAGWNATTSCSTPLDMCVVRNQPCLNGATCVSGFNALSCSCALGFTNTTCQTNIDDCASRPCKNGGVCTDGVANFSCACAPGWTGVNCTVNIDDCVGNLCLNGGQCIDRLLGYNCSCRPGFTGATCAVNHNDCLINPCRNNGTCIDGYGGINNYTCNCRFGYTGVDCTTLCSPNPCSNNATCRQESAGNVVCDCKTGWTGATCATNIDDCAASPCQHGGTCVDGVASYNCLCLPGFGPFSTSAIGCNVLAPRVVTLVMQNDGEIKMTFDYDTNQPGGGGAFSLALCRAVLSPASLALIGGSAARCRWGNGQNAYSVFRIRPGVAATVLPFYPNNVSPVNGTVFNATASSTLWLKDGAVYDNSEVATTVIRPLLISLPGNAAEPVAVISGVPSVVGVCQGVAVDASQSLNLWGRLDATNFAWALNGQLVASGSMPVLVLAPLGIPAGTNSITLVITNIFAESSSSYQISFMKRAVPSAVSLTINGPAQVDRVSVFYLLPVVSFPTCPGSNATFDISTTAVSYQWSLISGSSLSVAQPVLAVLFAQQSLVIHPGYLNVSSLLQNVVFQLTMQLGSGADLQLASAQWTVNVQALPPVSVILGGDRSVSISRNLTLDGSQSYDPNIVGVPPAFQTPIMFAWSCAFVSGPEIIECASRLASGANTAIPTLFFDPAILGRGVFQFSLAITSASYSGSRSVGVQVEITESIIPLVSLQGPNLIAPADTLRIFCVAQSVSQTLSSDLAFSWTETLQYVNIANQTYRASPGNSASFVLRPGLLQPGATYRFQVTVSDPLASPSSPFANAVASLSVTVDAPPCCGMCSISPLTGGSALVTPYGLTCAGWTDIAGHGPLTYSYSFSEYPIPQGAVFGALTSILPSPAVDVLLPPGQVAIRAMIFNSRGVAQIYDLPDVVQVGPMPASLTGGQTILCTLRSINSTLLYRAQALGDTSATIQLLNLLITLLSNSTTLLSSQQNAVVCNGQQVSSSSQQIVTDLWQSFLEALRAVTTGPISIQLAEALTDMLIRLVTQLTSASTTAQSVDLVLSIIRAIISQAATSVQLCQSLVLVLSSLLSSVPCPILDSVTQMIGLLSRRSLAGSLPQEDILNFLTPSVSSSNARVFGTSGFNLSVSNLLFSFDPEVLSVAGAGSTVDFVDVTITRYGATVRRCRGGAVVGDVVSIDISLGGNLTNISGLTNGIEFWLPIDPDIVASTQSSECEVDGSTVTVESGSQFQCSWWDPFSQVWTTSGCSTVGSVVKDPDGSQRIKCRCLHLTDFGVLVAEIESNCQVAGSTATVYKTFSVIYLFLSAASIIQLIRQSMAFAWQFNTVFAQHFLIAATSLTRSLSAARFSGALPWKMPLGGIAVVSALPWLLVFWIFSLFIFQWAAILIGSKQRRTSFSRYYILFIVTNVLVVVASMALFACVVWIDGDTRRKVALVGSIVLSAISCGSGVAFFVYGVQLWRSLHKSKAVLDDPTPPQRSFTARMRDFADNRLRAFCCTPTIGQKMILFASIVSGCFLLESLAWILSVAQMGVSGNSPVFTALTYGAEVIALMMVMLLFSRAVKESYESRKSKGGSRPSSRLGSKNSSGDKNHDKFKEGGGEHSRKGVVHSTGSNPNGSRADAQPSAERGSVSAGLALMPLNTSGALSKLETDILRTADTPKSANHPSMSASPGVPARGSLKQPPNLGQLRGDGDGDGSTPDSPRQGSRPSHSEALAAEGRDGSRGSHHSISLNDTASITGRNRSATADGGVGDGDDEEGTTRRGGSRTPSISRSSSRLNVIGEGAAASSGVASSASGKLFERLQSAFSKTNSSVRSTKGVNNKKPPARHAEISEKSDVWSLYDQRHPDSQPEKENSVSELVVEDPDVSVYDREDTQTRAEREGFDHSFMS